ncbi:hypothetical protein A9G11_11025 [Gilliamella sp. wkB108]|nr:hypothetical protein A9G11_11025 [Gilliamella apicola]
MKISYKYILFIGDDHSMWSCINFLVLIEFFSKKTINDKRLLIKVTQKYKNYDCKNINHLTKHQ